MQKEGILQKKGLVDPETLPDIYVVVVGITLMNLDLVEKAEEFSKLRSVASVCAVAGRFDIILTAMLTEEYGINEFYTKEISMIEDIRTVETFVVLKSFNLKVPFVP